MSILTLMFLAPLAPLCPLIGWVIGAKVKGRPLAGFLWGLIGPPGWLVVLLFYGGTVRCQDCGQMTPSAAAQDLPAHLFCRRCGVRVEGV
jgi:hypothetical protein